MPTCLEGNIRELKNVLERALIRAETDTLTADQLPFDIRFAPRRRAKLPSV